MNSCIWLRSPSPPHPPHLTPHILQRSSHGFSLTMPYFAPAETRFLGPACKRISQRPQLVLGVCHGFRMMRRAAIVQSSRRAFLLNITRRHFVATALSDPELLLTACVDDTRSSGSCCSRENRSDGPFIASTRDPIFWSSTRRGNGFLVFDCLHPPSLLLMKLILCGFGSFFFFFFCDEAVSEGGDEHLPMGVKCPL